ncbi:hypothetical protein [Arsukibacterium sp.]|uniref:hypothetical protein n=1 Tax=Arsukibacterium sp. TaxID=1977258 RepID=UPI002FDB27E9
MTGKPEALTICLSRAIARIEQRNQQEAMLNTARQLRAATRDIGTYNALGDFISASPAERHAIVTLMGRMF